MSDAGRGADRGANGSAGHGPHRMRARVVRDGVEPSARPREEGRLRVTARLPIEPAAGP